MKKIVGVILWLGAMSLAQAEQFALICSFQGSPGPGIYAPFGGTNLSAALSNTYLIDEERKTVDGKKAFFSEAEISFMDITDPRASYFVTMDRYARTIRITRQDNPNVKMLGECRKADKRAF